MDTETLNQNGASAPVAETERPVVETAPPIGSGQPPMYSVAWYDAIIAQNQQALNNMRAEIEAMTVQMHETSGIIKVFVQLREVERQKEAQNGGTYSPT